MAGIVFFKTNNLENIVNFYQETVGADIWLKQAECVILRHGNFLFGFCEKGDEADLQGLLCFFYDNEIDVDNMYSRMKKKSEGEPVKNSTYNIFHFFAKGPDGR